MGQMKSKARTWAAIFLVLLAVAVIGGYVFLSTAHFAP